MKKTLLKVAGVIIITLFALNGCKKDNPTPDPVAPLVSVGKQITYFKIVTPAVTGVIDTLNKTVSIGVPAGTDLTSITTDISLAAGHSISPASGVAMNFKTPVAYTVTRPNKATTTWTVTVANLGVNVDQDISQSVTWTADKTYFIKGEINIGNNSVLTIQPGTVIKFDANSKLSIGYYSNATILANGTADKPIIFTSSALIPAAGAWEGLYFYEKTLSNSSLSYCNITFAGSDTNYGALNLIGCDMAINNCNVSLSGSYGIFTTYSNSKGGFVSFANNTVSTTAKYGLVIDAHKAGTIGTGNTFTNVFGISLKGDYKSTETQTWKNLNVPYVISSEMDIDGNLTIEPGTKFKFDVNGWLSIGYYAATTFIADGLAATPITFTTSAASPVAGAWRGIAFYEFTQTTSKMSYCIIEYAGSTPTNGAIEMNNTSSISFTHNIVRNSGSYGVNNWGDAGFQAFTNNTISGCVNHLIVISTKHFPDLGIENLLTAADGKGILISGDIQYTSAVTWKKQSADIYVTGGEVDIDGIVTIEAGSRFLFVNDAFFWFGYYASTKITAIGTSTSKITFTSASLSPAAGTWKGLYFDENHVQANSELSYCQLQYTGLSGKPAIYTGISFPVSNTTITDFSSAHAAEYKTGITVPAGAGNNFTWFAN